MQFTKTLDITPATNAGMIRNPVMINLQELVVDECRSIARHFSSPMTSNKLAKLLRTLETYTPLLEIFQWSNQRLSVNRSLPHFDTFKDLRHLRKLHIDVGLLVRLDDTNLTCLSNPYTLIPASLEELTLDNFNMRHLQKLIRAFHPKLEQADNKSEALQTNLASLAAIFPPLKRLSLIVSREMETQSNHSTSLHELDPVDVTFFRCAADGLETMGVGLEVWRKAGGVEPEKKMLVRAGWTAPLPHYVDGGNGGSELEYDDGSEEDSYFEYEDTIDRNSD